MPSNIKAGIIGGAGYTGGELLRLLINHSNVEISFVHSRTYAGKPLDIVHHDLLGSEINFTDQYSNDVDVLFLCAGHGEALKFLSGNTVSDHIKIIDLSHDFRLSHKSSIGNREFVYGLPELNKEKIKSANNIANPGCFATAIQLGLLPLAEADLLSSVYSTGITGSTGAGQSLSETGHFSWRANNIQAYKSLSHQHIDEILESVQQLQTQSKKHAEVNFIPWRGDFTRGIFISSQLKCDLSIIELKEIYIQFYKDAAFTKFSTEPIFLKQVLNTNNCFIQLEKVGENLVVHSVIDNLLKGASGQAVQNMNLMFGFEETTGLKLKAAGF